MKALLVVVVLGGSVALLAGAQMPGWGDRPPRDPFLELFDADGDGQLSPAEIDGAAAILRQRDRNGDGIVTHDELPRPPRPGERRRDGGPPPRDRAPRSPEPQADLSQLPAGTVVFRGGHDTDPRDGGRPVVLIAAALGVEPQVFRDAFSGVRPARGRGPTGAEARANKQVLMSTLAPHGITNDRLDEVSNYYRYRPQSGEKWTHRPARATAIVKNGQVVGFDLTDAGAGYSTPPRVEVVGYPNLRVQPAIEHSKDLRTNGRIQSLDVVQ